jgi:hypothetical protein
MSTHSSHGAEDHKPEEIDASQGYEQSDVRATGIIVFLVAMSIFVAVVAIVAYGVGKAADIWMARGDGPPNKWSKTVDVRELGTMPSSPELQKKMAELVQQFPTPRLQTDDGLQDIANLHKREDLLLDHYTWVNRSQGKVRIPIERAMELIAQRGLPVAPATEQPTLMTGDSKPTIVMPLTNGFARTSFEQEQAVAQSVEEKRVETQK